MSYSRKEAFLKKIYGEILAGSSRRFIRKREAFIKHFSPVEQAFIDDNYVKYFDLATSSGLPTLAEKLIKLDAQGLWTNNNEIAHEQSVSYLAGLQNNKKNLVLSSQLDAINKEILDVESTLLDDRFRRSVLIQLTAESFAEKKINETYIAASLFTDPVLSKPFLSAEEYDELDGDEFQGIIQDYNEQMGAVSPENFKKIAIAEFFRGLFVLAGDNIYHFYGKPVTLLTHAQMQLFSYGRVFNNILSQTVPDQDYSDNPDGLLDWYHLSKNADQVFGGEQSKKTVGYMGVTKEDVAKMPGKEAFSVFDVAHSDGTPTSTPTESPIIKKTLSMKQLMAL